MCQANDRGGQRRRTRTGKGRHGQQRRPENCNLTPNPSPGRRGEPDAWMGRQPFAPARRQPSMPRLLRPRTFTARALRRRSTPAERMLWQMLRGRQVMHAKFRRQHPIGPFIVDFFCKQARLVVEADGAPHFPKPLRDRRRDAWFAAAGFVVLRLPNHLILHHPDRVLDQIHRLLAAHLPAPLSVPERGWGHRR